MLSAPDQQQLLQIARTAVEAAAHQRTLPSLNLQGLPPTLTAHRSSFVTLTHHGGELRGCIGGLEPRLPLAQDVQEHAMGAATSDPRFPPVSPSEVAKLHIEISVLTPQEAVAYATPEDLLKILRPHVDGVTLVSGYRRATFLPQVWEKISHPRTFLEMLSEKMGLNANAWRTAQVFRYQVELFEEQR